MIGTLVRLDLTPRKLLVFAMAMVITMIPVAALPADFGTMLIGGTAMPVLFIVAFSGRPGQRATLFEVALPISGRQLFLARTVSRLLVIWSAAVLWALVVIARTGVSTTQLMYVAEGAAALTLAMFLPQLVRVRELSIPGQLVAAILSALVVVVAAAVYLLPQGLMLVLLPLAIAATFLKAWVAIPASFQTAPARAVARGIARPERVVSVAPPDVSATMRFPWWPALRSVLSWQAPAFFLVMVLQGMGGGMFYFLFMFCAQAATFSRQRARWMYALPVSYRKLLLLVLASSTLPLLGGLAIGTGIRHITFNSPSSRVGDGPVHALGTKGWSATNVPLTFWHVARAGHVPDVQTPWGETITPAVIPVAGFTFYNPYYTARDASPRLIQWQWERAAEAVYGRHMQYSERETTTASPVTQQPRMIVVTAATLLVFVLCLLWVIELNMWQGLRRPSASKLRVAILVLSLVPVGAAFVVDLWFMFRHGDQFVVPLIQALLLRVSGVFPQDTVVLIAVAAIPILAAYWLLERQFGKAELVWQAGVRNAMGAESR